MRTMGSDKRACSAHRGRFSSQSTAYRGMRGWRPSAALLYSGTIALQYWEYKINWHGLFSFPGFGYYNSHRTTMRRTQQDLCATCYQKIDYGWHKVVIRRTFSFKALRNPTVSTILTKESFGYKDAETSDGTRVRTKTDKGESRILIIE